MSFLRNAVLSSQFGKADDGKYPIAPMGLSSHCYREDNSEVPKFREQSSYNIDGMLSLKIVHANVLAWITLLCPLSRKC